MVGRWDVVVVRHEVVLDVRPCLAPDLNAVLGDDRCRAFAIDVVLADPCERPWAVNGRPILLVEVDQIAVDPRPADLTLDLATNLHGDAVLAAAQSRVGIPDLGNPVVIKLEGAVPVDSDTVGPVERRRAGVEHVRAGDSEAGDLDVSALRTSTRARGFVGSVAAGNWMMASFEGRP